ncbi:MAG: potassium/proton antiporter [Thermogemmatispora sp.]|jgi:cell volume regulation protein A|uniref:potassium/proton antiporter n=1 Tax=Thermogemmatispora sp. TaxID=1968838 RepID=UPI001A01001C|nr:potassium/proton antiporter [Thermogemmatispora sp.]MBE3568200.1 potassium/proton antiporter [Thermogemmatispora sp.]
MHFESALLVASLLLLLSVLAWKIAGKLGIPALLLFLGLGMLAGSDGPGGIYFDNAQLAQAVGIVALVLILFAGGLETRWSVVRPALGGALLLSTLGVLLSALVVALFSAWLLHASPLEGLLLGALISATDAAAVFSVLAARNLHLSGQLLPLLELESGTNDPMAVFLTLGLIRLLSEPETPLLSVLLLFVQQMGIGLVLGLVIGGLAIWLIRQLHLDVEGLYQVLTIALALFTYAATALLGGSGFLAVYLVGLLLGNSRVEGIERIGRFHDSLAWLMQIAMFLILGLLVFPSRLPAVALAGVLITLVSVLVARPLAVLLALLPLRRMPLREKLFVAWVGLRGAVPIVLATFPLLAGLPRAELLFDLVFFVVLASVLLQGTTVPLVAGRLGVARPAPASVSDAAAPEASPSASD